MKKIVVVGADGQLGRELEELSAQYPAYRFYFFYKDHLDITVKEDVDKMMRELTPDYLINCAAYTAVDMAEKDVETTFAVNAAAVGILANACIQNHTRFVHISTDYVFDGTAATAYKEEDAVRPANIYGQSKLKGEEEAGKDENVIIIRTAWVYSTFGHNFVKTMLRLMRIKPELNVVDDQQGSPTYAADLAEAILQIIQSGKWVPGIYHFTNEGVITWFEFASEIKNQINTSCLVHPIPTEQYPTPAKRPKYSVLDKTKIQQTFGIKLKNWKESLQECLAKMPVEQS